MDPPSMGSRPPPVRIALAVGKLLVELGGALASGGVATHGPLGASLVTRRRPTS
jgi:hypothetical protein